MTEVIERACDFCADPDDPAVSLLPMYGVAPHDCYWRKGPQFTIGQSTLVPFKPDDCFVPELMDGETWADFKYPSACGVFYCPSCQGDRYRSAWDAVIAKHGEPPEAVGSAMLAAAIGREG